LGYSFEIKDIINNQFLSRECLESNTSDEFYRNLEKHNKEMDDTRKYSKKTHVKPKHVALLENGQATVKLCSITENHPFYNLSGSDNMIIITTKYYNKNPICIRGPGAGAEVTASGIISDIFQLN